MFANSIFLLLFSECSYSFPLCSSPWNSILNFFKCMWPCLVQNPWTGIGPATDMHFHFLQICVLNSRQVFLLLTWHVTWKSNSYQTQHVQHWNSGPFPASSLYQQLSQSQVVQSPSESLKPNSFFSPSQPLWSHSWLLSLRWKALPLNIHLLILFTAFKSCQHLNFSMRFTHPI